MSKNNDYNREYCDSSDESCSDNEENDKNNFDEKIEVISSEIKDAVINYAKMNGLPICEYLQDKYILNYIKWLLSR